MTRLSRAGHWFLLGGWVLLMPPVPMGTALPPISKWTEVSAHPSAGECDAARDAMRKTAKRTVASDSNASALKVAAALGKLQARCVERDLPSDSAGPVAPTAPEAPAAPKPAGPLFLTPP